MGRRPNARLLKWVVECVAPTAALESVTGLRRGEPPWLVTFSGSSIDAVVVRVGDESSVALLETEAAALEAIADTGVPGPRLLAMATGGRDTPGLFAVVMSRMPG